MAKEFKQLTKAEESVMQALWEVQKGFVKDVQAAMPQPPPHYNTVSTLLKILVEKKFVASRSVGNALEFRPLISREDYSRRFATTMLHNFFGGSLKNFISAFSGENMDAKEVDEIISLLKNKKS